MPPDVARAAGEDPFLTAFATADHDHRAEVTRTYVCSGVDFKPFDSTVAWRHQTHE